MSGPYNHPRPPSRRELQLRQLNERIELMRTAMLAAEYETGETNDLEAMNAYYKLRREMTFNNPDRS
jgi:hypothetical protein